MAEQLTLTVPEVAERLRVSPRSVYRLIERNDLHAVRVGRLFRIPVESLQQYLRGDQRPVSDGSANRDA
jgi:excisionase family DNA binding protein